MTGNDATKAHEHVQRVTVLHDFITDQYSKTFSSAPGLEIW